MTKPKRPTLRIDRKVVKAVKEFEDAVIKYAFKGSQAPEDIPAIIQNLDQKKLKLYYAIQEFKDGK